MSASEISATFNRALLRNLDEARVAILDHRALSGIEAADPYTTIDFFLLAYWALRYDYVARAAKLFDTTNGSTSFWFLYRSAKDEIGELIVARGLSVERLENLSNRVRIVRNKTHFHIDKKAVLNPKGPWKEAGIKPDELLACIDGVFCTLNELHIRRIGHEFWLPEYDGSDIAKILELAKAEGLVF